MQFFRRKKRVCITKDSLEFANAAETLTMEKKECLLIKGADFKAAFCVRVSFRFFACEE